MKPIKISELPSNQMKIAKTGEQLSIAQSLSDAFQINSLLVHREELLPGRRASSPHYHTTKEELFVVVSGNPSLWANGEITQLSPDQCVGFSKDSRVARMIVNYSNTPAIILTIGSNTPDDEICYVDEKDFNLKKTV